ncbi:DUF2273 domain-containing protein [Alkalicella caledoniensis]|uniref:DUF2273 domain-containing protein n=1 Tax=Alkalicella caledoniensis TaxID=2731377 RepID=A0A7G9WBU2_ALKCA|nr:DUF2273 domain-containing protein [Alkalicella caledoniensis]QNO16154.1 DUF2273 domain-containing protein [Alkalicella caledoniensis]
MWQDIKKMVLHNKGKVAGSLVGLLFSLFYIYFGFIKATFIVLCITIGFFVGKRLDDGNDFIQSIKKLLGPRDF